MKKEKFYLPAMILQLIGIVASLILCTQTLATDVTSRGFQINAVFVIASLIASLIYLFLGARKQSAVYFKYYAWLFALSELATVVSFAVSDVVCIYAVPASAIAFALVIALALSTNLGKSKSYTLCGIIFAINLVSMIMSIMMVPGVGQGGNIEGSLYFIHTFSLVNLSGVFGIMIFAKYIDKAERSSK